MELFKHPFLHFIQVTPGVDLGGYPAGARATEDGTVRVTEDGTVREVE